MLVRIPQMVLGGILAAAGVSHDKSTGKLRIILESATEVGKPVLFGRRRLSLRSDCEFRRLAKGKRSLWNLKLG